MSKRDEIKLLFAKGTGFYAQGHFTQALTIFQDIWAKAEVENLDINASVLCFLAKIYHKFGDFQKGKEFGKLALNNARKSGKPDLIVQCQIILGHVYVHLSNYDKAKMLFKNSLQIMQEFKIKKLMPLAVDCLQELGNIYQLGNRLDKAIKCYEQALNIAKNEKNNEKINYLLQKVALCQINLGRTEEAVKTTTSITDKGKALDVIGTLYYVSGNYEAAGSCMEEALATVSHQKDNLKIVQILNSLGSIRKQMGEYEKALHYFTKAAKILTDYYLPDEAYRIYYNLGRLYEQLKDTNKAIECYEQSVNYIEELRSEISVEDYQLGFMVDKERVYEALIGLYVKTGKEMEAWHYLERAKSRYLLSLLSSPQIHIQKGLKEKEIGKEQNIIAKITKLRKELYQVGPHEQAELQQQLLEATREYKDFLSKIQLSNPELASLKLVAPFSLEEVQFCLNQDEVLLEYFYSKEKLYCWVLSQKGSQCIELSNITRDALKEQSRKMLECFDNKGG
ncbi:MAG: tetratricopeptide repeat protein, partial [Candidatus Margulisiibacteriota bacterium]